MLVIGAWSSIDNGDGSGSTGGGSGASVTNSAGTTIYLNYLPGWGDVSNWQDYINVTLPRTPAVTSAYLINEPLEYEIVTDQTTGLSYSYSAIEEAFENNPELIEQIKADNSSATLPGPLINLSGIMFSQAYFKEAEITKIEHPDWSEGKIYAVALWNTIGGTTHFLLDVAGFVPVIGEAASLINGAIYFAEGDKINCALSLAAAIPVTGWVSIAGKWVKTTVSSVPIIEAAGKVAYKAVQVGKEMRLVKVAVSIFDYASIKALQAIKPADQTLTNLSRSLIDRFATRIAPTEPAMKTMIDDIVLNLDLQGTKTEALSEAMFQNANYVSHPAKFGSNNGFDGVFSVHISGRLNDPFEIVINESKQMSSVGSIKLSPQAGKTAQMSDVWIDQTIQEMRDYASDSAVQQTGEYLYAHRALITKTVTCVDKTTGEIVLLKLTNY